MQKKKGAYCPDIELAKGAKFETSSYDKTQTIKVISAKVTVGGTPGIAEISGVATGRTDASINGTIGIWLSIFRYMRPDGTINHVAGWNITIPLTPKQTPLSTARSFAQYINSHNRPYKAKAKANPKGASLTITFTNRSA